MTMEAVTMYSHILLPLDGSPLAEHAIPYAEDLARKTGAKLTIMSCVEPYVITVPVVPTPIPAYGIDTDVETLANDRLEYLESVREAIHEEGMDVDVALHRGRPPDEILRTVEEKGADLIVMTTHGRSGISRFIYGSVAERVLHGAKVPVLLIRATE